tara:strand:- start:1019 stop:2755 length:1737 start_codon:yes stop_codon:yes gene_type:complete
MKNLNLLNKIIFSVFLIFIISFNTSANEPVDIWNIEKIQKKIDKEEKIDQSTKIQNSESLLKLKNKKQEIFVDNNLLSSNVKLVGLYDPSENGLSINMWENTDGEIIKKILNDIDKKQLSNFSLDILDIALLTNSYLPKKNISSDEFNEFKIDHLIKRDDVETIKEFLIKNPDLNNNHKLVRYYLDYYLSRSEINKSCEIFNYLNNISNQYLNYFKIYCLINDNKKEEAQLLFDLSSELNQIDNFFSKKFFALMDFSKNYEVSDENLLFFHLSHKTDKNFLYEPNIKSSKLIWEYLSSSNLLKKADMFDFQDVDQIQTLEKATNEKIYNEKDLFEIYKKFQFDINQLLSAIESYKILPAYEGRALLYQRLILSIDTEQKLIFAAEIKKSFLKSNLKNIFNDELVKILKNIKEKEVPSNFTSFYNNYKEHTNIKVSKIKINNKIIHQSKLINYFLNKISLLKVEKDTNEILKRIKQKKKYKFSIKDKILLESLKSDGVKIKNNYQDLYEYNFKVPEDIKNLIKQKETGLILLKLAETIGEDSLKDLDLDSVSFIVGILNEMKNIELRNKIILETLPLKV